MHKPPIRRRFTKRWSRSGCSMTSRTRFENANSPVKRKRKRPHRLTHTKPKVDAFFDWVDRQFERQGLPPSNPFTQALNYVRERRLGLEVFLSDPDVPMDTNHLERALRVIPMGRRNWLFTWTELGGRAGRHRAESDRDLQAARH